MVDCKRITENVREKLKKDYKTVDLSFLPKDPKLTYIKFYNKEDMTTYLFDIIEKENLKIGVFPIVGGNKIKWFSKSITDGPVLVSYTSSIFNDKEYIFVGVTK